MAEKVNYEVDINVITLNCWGIPGISKNRVDRMNAIAKCIASSNYDIICLQEVWSEEDFVRIKEQANENIPFSHYFYSGVIGSGLCVLSRFPIQEVYFHQWAVNGYIHKIHHGDWFGGKGIGLCRLQHAGLSINVYTAHLHAEYDRNCDLYRSHRVQQAFDTAQFIRLTSSSADVVILGGDLNTEPGDLPYRIICHQAALHDAGLNNESGTNGAERNSYSDPKASLLEPNGKRIDYIMYTAGPTTSARLVSYTLPLSQRVPASSFSYSDHEAVCASIKIKRLVFGEAQDVTKENGVREAALKEGITECEEAMKRLSNDRTTYYVYSAILCVFLVVICVLSEMYGYRFFDVLRLLVTIALCFTLCMATLWNRIEKNVTLAAKLAMEVAVAHDTIRITLYAAKAMELIVRRWEGNGRDLR